MGYSMRLELIRVCSLNDFLLVMGLYRGHPLFFLNSKNNFEKYKSLRGPTYFQNIFILSLDLQQFSFISPLQENKAMEKMIKEILVNLENIKENQKRLEEEVKEIHLKINIFAHQQIPPQKKPEENNTKPIIEYIEKELQLYGK